MSKSNALSKWFDDPEKAEKLQNRVGETQKEIDESGIITRSEEESENVDEQEEEVEEEGTEVEGNEQEIEFVLDDESISEIADAVAGLLEERVSEKLNSIVDRVSNLEKAKEVKEDKPLVQKIRFKSLDAEKEQNEPEEKQVSSFVKARDSVKDIRKQRMATLRTKSQEQ